nr:conserved hypothetical protein [Hymenolepis microstoma]
MLSDDLRCFLQKKTNFTISERQTPQNQPIDPWNTNITQQIRHLTKASRRQPRLQYLSDNYLSYPEAKGKSFKGPHSSKAPNDTSKERLEENRTCIRQEAQEVVTSTIILPFSQAMTADSLAPLYDDAGRQNPYAGLSCDVILQLFHEDKIRIMEFAHEMVESVSRKAIYRARWIQAQKSPWLCNTKPIFGLEQVYHSRHKHYSSE